MLCSSVRIAVSTTLRGRLRTGCYGDICICLHMSVLGKRTFGARVQSTKAGAETAAKTAILRASLQHIPKLGWNVNSLKAGARAVGLELDESLFPGKEWELVEYFEKKSNEDLVQYMQHLRGRDDAP